jgi:hypothetical protein
MLVYAYIACIARWSFFNQKRIWSAILHKTTISGYFMFVKSTTKHFPKREKFLFSSVFIHKDMDNGRRQRHIPKHEGKLAQ